MNKILLGSVALAALLAGPAMAADMGVPRTFAAPPPSWTGFYVGGNFGGVWGNTDPGFISSCGPNELPLTSTAFPTNFSSTVPPGGNQGVTTCHVAGISNNTVPSLATAAGVVAQDAAGGNSALTQVGTQPFHNNGWTGGGQIGFNYQYQWAVFGIEADFSAFRPKGSQNVTGAYPNSPGLVPCSVPAIGGVGFQSGNFGGCQFGFSESSNGKWLTTVRGRVGAVWGNWMVYGTMGVAWAKMDFTSNFADATCGTTVLPTGCNLASNFTVTQTKVGPVGGVGLSYMVTRNWIASVEYLRTELWGYGGDTRAVTTASGNPAIPVGTFGANFHYDVTYIENIVRFKLDYKL